MVGYFVKNIKKIFFKGYLMLYKVNLNENNEGTKLSTTRFRSSIRRLE